MKGNQDVNTLKASLRSGTPTLGCWLTLGSPAAAELMAHVGFDWLVIDLEHAPNNPATAVEQIRAIDAARTHGAVSQPVIRVAACDPILIKRAMDIGCETLIVPNVDTETDARTAAAAMRFPDSTGQGSRGVAGLVRAGRYGLDLDYVATANGRACTIVQIESAQAIDNVWKIAAVDGVDCLFIGGADLSASMGKLGQPTHPEVRQAIEQVFAAAAAHEKAVGAFAVDVQDAQWYRERGATFVSLHSDVAWLARGARGSIADLSRREAANP